MSLAFLFRNVADLTGLKVAHDLSRFKDGGEIILTLKDSAILENDEDHERLQKNLDNKKKKPGYLAYDDDEFTLAGGQKRDILSQYDEDIDGPKKSTLMQMVRVLFLLAIDCMAVSLHTLFNQTFVIGKDGTVSTDPMTTKKSVSEKLKAQSVNLSYDTGALRCQLTNNLPSIFLATEMKEIKDYYTKDEADVTFKKPKRKKKVRKKAEDQEPIDDTIGTDAAENNDGLAPMEEDDREPLANQAEVSFVDDDDLQQALARARRIANKKKEVVRLSVEDIMRTASRIRSEDRDDEDIGATSGGLVISDTSEFVNSLQEAPVIAARTLERVERTRSVTPTAQPMEEDDEDHRFSDENVKTDNEKENGGRDGEAKEMEEPPVASTISFAVFIGHRTPFGGQFN
ncbi:SART-1 protein, partial [Jimgerdemannia flammicorona]